MKVFLEVMRIKNEVAVVGGGVFVVCGCGGSCGGVGGCVAVAVWA